MSSGVSFPPGLTILGGIPSKTPDLAASIVFAVAYCLLVPLVAWRIFSPSSRAAVQVRPVAFVIVRVITFIFRALITTNQSNTGMYTAEQILLLCGFVLLCEPLLVLLNYHVKRNFEPVGGKRSLMHLTLILMRIALVAALVLGIIAGTNVGNLVDTSTGKVDQGKLSTFKTLRDVNAVLCLIITGFVVIIAVLAQMKESLPMRGTAFLVIVGLLLSIVSVFKLVFYFHKPAPSPLATSSKVVFYIFSSVPEFLVSVAYFVPNLKELFDVDEGKRKSKVEKLLRKGKPVPDNLRPRAAPATQGQAQAKGGLASPYGYGQQQFYGAPVNGYEYGRKMEQV